mgnify:CR=1 FL=1
MPHIDAFLNFMLEHKASDMHLSSGCPVAYRIDGEMVFTNSDPFDSDYIEALVFEIMSERNQNQFRECNDTDLAYSLPTGDRFRVNVFRDLHGVGVVARVIPANILTFEQLGLSPAIRDLCTLNKGLVLVTGPTGSGKSTTLAAMIDYINRTRTDHIITVEDPVEFVHPNKKCLINHREVGRHTRSFAAALRAALREDPDIVLVGEMRDLGKKIGKGRVAALEILLVTHAISNLIRENKVHMIESSIQTGYKLGMRTLNGALMELVRDEKISSEEAFFRAIDRDDLRKMMIEAEMPLPANAQDDAL